MKRAVFAGFCLIGFVAAASTIDLRGEWTVEGRGFSGPIILPGTLSEGGYGNPETYETWKASRIRPERGALRMIRTYVGPAVYSREVEIPDDLTDRELELFMERVLWTSSVRLDGTPIGSCDSLGTPHRCRFRATAGRHRLEIAVDNSPQYGFVGNSHGWGDSTQGVWHGVIGRFEIRPYNPLDEVQVFAPYPTERITLTMPKGISELDVRLDGVRLAAEGKGAYRLAAPPEPWSEFHPRLYSLELHTPGFVRKLRIGFRTIERRGRKLYLNGNPFWMRGDVDNCQFPLTGYPAMTSAEWKRQIRIQQENGCNAMRFHTWTPPQAAFDAADELGFCLFVETGYWGGAIGRGVPGLDDFCRAELKRMVAAYGNAPSFVGLEVGNELGGADFGLMSEWMREIKAGDPRRLTQCSTARQIAASDDYMVTHLYPGIGSVRCRFRAGTDWDYEDVYSKTDLPTIAHEVGQWPVYPLWTDISRFDGLLKAFDWQTLRETAERNGTLPFNRRYHTASLKTSRYMYKDEVEGYLRTPSCAGLQLLDVRDYTGQGEALVGWLDAFFDAKPGLSELPAFSDVLRPVAFLARVEKFVWTTGETLQTRLVIRNMTEAALPKDTTFPVSFGGRSDWVKLAKPVAPGEVAEVASVSWPLDRSMVTRRQELRFGSNRWSVFVMDAGKSEVPDGVTLTDDPQQAARALEAGDRVIYVGRSERSLPGRYVPVYWSEACFPTRGSCPMLGTWFAEDHPVFGAFPTEDWMDRQWRILSERSVVHELTDEAAALEIQALPVPDFHVSRRYATIFEANVGKGRLLVCGYPIATCDAPEARQLRKSVLDYVASEAFRPCGRASIDWFRRFAVSKRTNEIDRKNWTENRHADGSVEVIVRGCAHRAGRYTLVFAEDGAVTATFEGRKSVQVLSAIPVVFVSAEATEADVADGRIDFLIRPTDGPVPSVAAVTYEANKP